jgi:hypothetical protein
MMNEHLNIELNYPNARVARTKITIDEFKIEH